MFTGSTEIGKKVMERAAQTLTPVGLELGGKDPMIVLADADLERAANAAVYYSMQNGGQTCISVERVYVEEPVYDEFVAKVTEKVGALRQGAPGDPGSVDVGAVTSPPQMDIIDSHVRDAVAKGARAAVGGHRGQGAGRLLRAHRAGRRGPHDGVHDRGDVRADAADHEGGRRRGGGPAGQRLALRPPGLGVDQGHRPRASGWPAGSRPAVLRERRPDQLRGARAADGRLEGVRARAPATAADGIRKYTRQQSILVTRFAPKGTFTCSPTRRAPRSCSAAC